MTPVDPERAPRVSAETFDLICRRAERDEAEGTATTMQMIALDARARIATLEAENARLTAALASAERKGWIACREAAAEHVENNLQNCWECDGGYGFVDAIRALAPSAVSEGERDG